LKKRFTKKLVLVVLDLDKKRIKVDISDYAMKGDRNYKIYDKEMLVVIKEPEN